MTASRLAAVSEATPKSAHRGAKCGSTSPVLDRPQIAKVKARTQKIPVPEASRSAPRLRAKGLPAGTGAGGAAGLDRKSTRLNSSHANISYAVFCLKKKKRTALLRLPAPHN